MTGRPIGSGSELDRVVHVRPNGDQVTAAQSVLERITLGLEYQEAADSAGVSRQTLHTWRLQGAKARRKAVNGQRLTKGEQRYAAFLDDVERAHHQAHLERLAVIQRATQPFTVTKTTVKSARNDDGAMVETERTVTTETRPGQWTAAAWWLERKMPARYGRRIELSGQVAGGSLTAEQRAEDLAQSLRAYLDGQADGLKAASEAGDKAKAPRL